MQACDVAKATISLDGNDVSAAITLISIVLAANHYLYDPFGPFVLIE